MDAEWFTSTIDRARETDVFDNADLMSGEVWQEFAQAIGKLGEEVMRPDVPGNPLARAAGFRHLLVLLGTGINQIFMTSSPYRPSLAQITRTDIFKWGLDCPDCVYRTTEIKGTLNYRVTGRVVPHCYLGFQTNDGMRATCNLRLDEMTIAPDGSFELFIGPDAHEGNWMQTEPGCDMLITRQFFGDWDTERLVPLTIELLPGQALPDRVPEFDDPTPDRVARQIRALGKWMIAVMKFFNAIEINGQAHHFNAFPEPTVKTAMGGAAENSNAWGSYTLQPDEAIIVEVRPVPCLYWNLDVGNFWWESLEYANRHTSLNHHQARVDPDGICRMVISPVDPGVHNWLDTMGHLSGPLLYRWIVPHEPPEQARTRVVKIGEVLDHLPPGTPRCPAEERAAIIDRRRIASARRFSPIEG